MPRRGARAAATSAPFRRSPPPCPGATRTPAEGSNEASQAPDAGEPLAASKKKNNSRGRSSLLGRAPPPASPSPRDGGEREGQRAALAPASPLPPQRSGGSRPAPAAPLPPPAGLGEGGCRAPRGGSQPARPAPRQRRRPPRRARACCSAAAPGAGEGSGLPPFSFPATRPAPQLSPPGARGAAPPPPHHLPSAAAAEAVAEDSALRDGPVLSPPAPALKLLPTRKTEGGERGGTDRTDQTNNQTNPNTNPQRSGGAPSSPRRRPYLA